jgi:hypothetical protein
MLGLYGLLIDLNADIIDVSPKRQRKGGRIKWFVLAAVLLLIVLVSSVSIYIEALWFGSLGFSSRFWYVFAVGWALLVLFGILTFAIIRGGFYILERLFGPEAFKPRQIIINKQPVDVNIALVPLNILKVFYKEWFKTVVSGCPVLHILYRNRVST